MLNHRQVQRPAEKALLFHREKEEDERGYFEKLRVAIASHWLSVAIFLFLGCKPKPEGKQLMTERDGGVLLIKEKFFLSPACSMFCFGVWVAMCEKSPFRASQLHFK